MQKVTAYSIAVAPDPNALLTEVGHLLNLGYQPLGAIVVVHDPTPNTPTAQHHAQGKLVYHQTMIKYLEE